MADSNATERICELLAGRGIDYKLRRASGTSARETVFWEYEKDGNWATAEYAVTVPLDGYGTLEASHLTPEQAVAATMGADDAEAWRSVALGLFESLEKADLETAKRWICENSTLRDELAYGDAVAATLGADDGSRWSEMFGTPERAARTLEKLELEVHDYCWLVDQKCENCRYEYDSYGCCDPTTVLEWLRGKAVS